MRVGHEEVYEVQRASRDGWCFRSHQTPSWGGARAPPSAEAPWRTESTAAVARGTEATDIQASSWPGKVRIKEGFRCSGATGPDGSLLSERSANRILRSTTPGDFDLHGGTAGPQFRSTRAARLITVGAGAGRRSRRRRRSSDKRRRLWASEGSSSTERRRITDQLGIFADGRGNCVREPDGHHQDPANISRPSGIMLSPTRRLYVTDKPDVHKDDQSDGSVRVEGTGTPTKDGRRTTGDASPSCAGRLRRHVFGRARLVPRGRAREDGYHGSL